MTMLTQIDMDTRIIMAVARDWRRNMPVGQLASDPEERMANDVMDVVMTLFVRPTKESQLRQPATIYS
jgi:hypothetical protein